MEDRFSVLSWVLHWDYKNYNEYISKKSVVSSTAKKTFLKCDVIDGSIVNDLRQDVLFSFDLDKLSGYKFFCEPETIH